MSSMAIAFSQENIRCTEGQASTVGAHGSGERAVGLQVATGMALGGLKLVSGRTEHDLAIPRKIQELPVDEDPWRWQGPGAKGDYSDPPAFPGWSHRRYWTAAIRRWNKNTDIPLFRRGEKVLRCLGWELQADMEHITEAELGEHDYLEKILKVLDAKAGVRQDDEKRRAFKAVMTENQRRRDESLSQYSLRRTQDFQRATTYGFVLPRELQAAMLREGASLSEQNLQNLTALLQKDDSDPDKVAKGLCQLDVRTDKLIGFANGEVPAAGSDAPVYLADDDGDDDDELSDEEVLAELEALDLFEDQVCEVFAVLDGGGGFKKKRTWKENRLMKAEMKKDRGSFIKGSDAPPRGHGGGLPGGRDGARGREWRGGGRGRGGMSREQLKKISKCRGCGQKGHWVAECPNKGKTAAVSGFVYAPEPASAQAVAFSFLSRRELYEIVGEIQAAPQDRPSCPNSSVWSFLTMPSGDAIVDTGATQDLIGSTAFVALKHRLKDVGLQPIKVDVSCAVPSGIGGKATVEQVVLVPISPGGCAGVLQMVVLTADIPPLLSIGFLDFMGGIIDLPAKELRLSKYQTAVPLKELPSGHRSIPLIEWTGGKFEVPAPIREKFGLPFDAFNLKAMSSSEYTKDVQFGNSVMCTLNNLPNSCRQLLMYFKLAMAERAKKTRQGRLKYVTADESAAGSCIHPANRIIRRGNQWASWQVCTQCQARVAYASKPRGKAAAKAKAKSRSSANPVQSEGSMGKETEPVEFQPSFRRSTTPAAASSTVTPDLQVMMQAFMAGIQQQSADMNRAMDQINSSLRELARGQSQMMMMGGDLAASSSSGATTSLQQQAEQLARVAMEVDLSDEWDEVNPNAEDHLSTKAVPSWVLYQEREKAMDKLPPGARLVESSDHYITENVPTALHQVLYGIPSDEVPSGWKGVIQEVRAADGALLYRGTTEGCSDEETRAAGNAWTWLLPARLAHGWCTLGKRGHVEVLNAEGQVSSMGPIWIFFDRERELQRVSDAKIEEVWPEDPLRGDEAPCRKQLLEAFAGQARGDCQVDYLEIFTKTPLQDCVRRKGLRVGLLGDEAENLTAAGRTAVREGCSSLRPRILAARWESEGDGPQDRRSAVRDRLRQGLFSEVAEEQVRRGHHFLVDYPLPLVDPVEQKVGAVCDHRFSALIESHAHQVIVCHQHGQPRRMASSFAAGDLLKERVSSAEVLERGAPLGDRSREERMAKELLDANDFSFAACQDLIDCTSLPSRTTSRSGMPETVQGKLMCTFGLFSHGGVWGVTRQTKLRPHFTNYINSFLDWHGAGGPRTSFSVNTGVGLTMHLDKYNLPDTRNSLITFGKHAGGRLWAEDACQVTGGKINERSSRKSPSGQVLYGHMVNTYQKMATFDAHYYHEVEPWTGCRYSAACWANASVAKVDNRTRRRLRTLGFRLPRASGPGGPKIGSARPDGLCEAVLEACAAHASGSTCPSARPLFSFPSVPDPEDENEMEEGDEVQSDPRAEEAPPLRVTESQKRLVHKVHVNVGHPPKARFLRMMKAAGTLPHVMHYIKNDYECDQCSIRQRPDHRHRARCPRNYEFNRMLSIDVFYIKFGIYQVPILNMTDTGTCYQVLQRLPIATGGHGGTPTSDATWRAFLATWIRFFGPPEVLVCDSGSEFKAHFERGCEGQGILQHVVLPENPWKNAISERHGGFIKHRLDQELSSGRGVLQTWEDLDDFLHEMVSVKNRWLSRGGVSPTQLVFGKMPRIPGDLLSDDHTGLMALHDALEDPLGTDQAAAEFRRRMEVRERARQITMAQASREAVQRAVKASTHQSRRFYAGQWVYCFRRGRPGDPLHPRDRWVGPGLVVVANNSTVYVGMRTRLWRCSPSDPGMSELIRRVISGSTARAINVAREGAPPDGAAVAPVDRENAEIPLAGEAPQAAAEEVVPVPPGLLPPGLPPPPGDLPRDDLDRADGRAQHAENRQRGRPPEVEEPARKVPRTESPPGTRAPGTPMGPLLRAVQNAVRPEAEVPSSSSSLTPTENLPGEHRVGRQVREWEEVTAQRARERTPPPSQRDGDDSSEDLWATFEQEGWSGSFYNYRQGSQELGTDASGEWTWLAKRNDEVSLKQLAASEREMFAKSDLLEWQSILDSKAVKVLCGKQAAEARARHPSRILSSRMVRRKKPMPGLGQWKPKSRWCIHGHHDPDTGSLVTYSPTPASESLMLFLQASINLQHVRAFADVKAAFTQSLPIRRPAGPIFAEPCEGLSLPEGALIEILVPVYGLDDAPAAWRETVTQYLVEEEGFTRNLVEPCWFSKFVAGSSTCVAQVLVEVDDFIVSANPDFMPGLRTSMQKRFRFGKWEDGSAEYAGRLIEDKGDHLSVSQEKYILEQVTSVTLSRERKRQPDERLSPSEFESFRSLVYKLNWLGRETRPEAAGVASIMASRLQVASIKDVMVVNRFVNHLRNTANRPLKIWRFGPDSMAFVAVSDAGGVNTKETLLDDEGLPTDATQGAWLVLTAEALPEGDRRVRASPMSWRSSKLKRKVFSTVGGETQAMLQGVNEVEWMQVMYRDGVFHDVQLRSWQESLRPHMLVMKGEHPGGGRNPQCVVTDAKSLFDCILKEHPAGRQDRKSALELAIILRDLQRSKSMVRWIPHQKMIADGLTKEDPFAETVH
ncbi:unnamed protein product [Symbiodinium sp. CCMP2592]|nr:unnamed protein product [Symbiodinium sp. CCMP2592]